MHALSTKNHFGLPFVHSTLVTFFDLPKKLGDSLTFTSTLYMEFIALFLWKPNHLRSILELPTITFDLLFE